MQIDADNLSVRIDGERIVELLPPSPQRRGVMLVPAFVDAHVHMAFAGEIQGVSRSLLRGGVAAVLDLGAPERLLPLDPRPLRVRFSGPLLTSPGGYPTQTWGRDGYGLELSTADAARAAASRLVAAGARFVKLAFPSLADEVALAAADEAHRLGAQVAAHALDAVSVRRALDAGVDVLAHTPRDELPGEILSRVKGKWVVSTLRAFQVAPARLRELVEAGARVAYGTDLGNEGTAPGIDAAELSLLAEAGVDPLVAATAASAELLGFKDLGRLSVGMAASLLAVKSLQPADLAAPVQVMNCGKIVQ